MVLLYWRDLAHFLLTAPHPNPARAGSQCQSWTGSTLALCSAPLLNSPSASVSVDVDDLDSTLRGQRWSGPVGSFILQLEGAKGQRCTSTLDYTVLTHCFNQNSGIMTAQLCKEERKEEEKRGEKRIGGVEAKRWLACIGQRECAALGATDDRGMTESWTATFLRGCVWGSEQQSVMVTDISLVSSSLTRRALGVLRVEEPKIRTILRDGPAILVFPFHALLSSVKLLTISHSCSHSFSSHHLSHLSVLSSIQWNSWIELSL